jgi:FMN-dependent NADH-azoreductase
MMTQQTPPRPLENVLRIDGSARYSASTSRRLTDSLIAMLRPAELVTRDLAGGVPFVDEKWVEANFTPPEERTPEQQDTLAYSDTLVKELEAADTLVIGLPIYNFSIPASVKAWIDMITRARLTFRYGETGPEGLLTGKRAYIIVAAGGTAVGSKLDFATNYIKHILGFVGIKDVRIISAADIAAGVVSLPEASGLDTKSVIEAA